MEKVKLLIIEDNDDDFICLKDRLGYDILPDDKEKYERLQELLLRNPTEANKLICKIIKNNYKKLRGIICDLKMKYYDSGIDVIRSIRRQKLDNSPLFFEQIPIIVYTNISESTELMKTIEHGATHALAKQRNAAGELMNIIDLAKLVEKDVKKFSKFLLENQDEDRDTSERSTSSQSAAQSEPDSDKAGGVAETDDDILNMNYKAQFGNNLKSEGVEM